MDAIYQVTQWPARRPTGDLLGVRNRAGVHHWRSLFLILLFALAAAVPLAGQAAPEPARIVLGRSVVNLTGPWKFHTSDDTRWADPNFDDAGWESVDLTAPPGAHDDDVGLTGYVPGWGSRGHRGYSGYAWYRMRVAITAPDDQELTLAGPPAVDSAYQVFINGHLLGGSGGFSGATPTAFSIQPRRFAIPRAFFGGEGPGSALIAFRVWMGPWELADSASGGIHIAPALGEASAIDALYQMQWLQTIKGYVVEVVEAAIFVLLAVMAWTVAAFERSKRPYGWLCAALVLTAMFRANQAVFFWGQFESVHAAEMISGVLLQPLCLCAWTLAWHAWLVRRRMEWMPMVVGILTVVYITAQFLMGSWFHGVLPVWIGTASGFVATWTRRTFVLLTAIILGQAIRQHRREAWLPLTAAVLLWIGQFAREVSALGIRGIWFPFGTGVSRTQYAYAIFAVALFALLLRRLLFFAHQQRSLFFPETHELAPMIVAEK
jgi:hypothetical protein